MDSNYPNPKRDYTVLVRCFTFNQSKYIEDALNGFVMQQTTFPFVCLVVDDASTDGEPEVIKSWMERECDMADAKHIDIPNANVIIVSHKTNSNCTMAVYLLKENLFRQGEKKLKYVTPWREHCRYEAICEGDDYWTEPLKLQKQVDFMDSNPDCSMCFHNAVEHYENGHKKDMLFSDIQDKDYSGEDLFHNWIVPTASVLYKRDDRIIKYNNKLRNNPHIIFGDICLFLSCSFYGRIHGMNDIMSVYRKQENGLTAGGFTYPRYRKLAWHEYSLGKELGGTFYKIGIRKFVKINLDCFVISITDKNHSIDYSFLKDAFLKAPFLTCYKMGVHLKRYIKNNIKRWK